MKEAGKDTKFTKWVTVEKYCELSGDSRQSVYNRRSRGVWHDGLHCRKVPTVGLMVNVEEVEKWIESCPVE